MIDDWLSIMRQLGNEFTDDGAVPNPPNIASDPATLDRLASFLRELQPGDPAVFVATKQERRERRGRQAADAYRAGLVAAFAALPASSSDTFTTVGIRSANLAIVTVALNGFNVACVAVPVDVFTHDPRIEAIRPTTGWPVVSIPRRNGADTECIVLGRTRNKIAKADYSLAEARETTYALSIAQYHRRLEEADKKRWAEEAERARWESSPEGREALLRLRLEKLEGALATEVTGKKLTPGDI